MVGGSPTYNKMLQRLYKELMSNGKFKVIIMWWAITSGLGFVSFTLAMYQASNPKLSSKSWTNVVDFVGYVIFFAAIFFVAHALYIMALSIISAKQYEMYHSMTLASVLKELSNMEHDAIAKFWFYMKYLPFSSCRSRAEFKIIYALFRDTYVMTQMLFITDKISGTGFHLISITGCIWVAVSSAIHWRSEASGNSVTLSWLSCAFWTISESNMVENFYGIAVGLKLLLSPI